MTQNQYLVKTTQRNGDYETWMHTVVTASSEDEAETFALLNSCHHSEGEGAYFADNGIYDRHGEVHYKVRGTTLLTKEQADMLKELGIR